MAGLHGMFVGYTMIIRVVSMLCGVDITHVDHNHVSQPM